MVSRQIHWAETLIDWVVDVCLAMMVLVSVLVGLFLAGMLFWLVMRAYVN